MICFPLGGDMKFCLYGRSKGKNSKREFYAQKFQYVMQGWKIK